MPPPQPTTTPGVVNRPSPAPQTAVPGYDRAALKWMSGSGPAFPYGRDHRATQAVRGAMFGPAGERAEGAKALNGYLHGDSMRRGVHYAAVAQGYPNPRQPGGALTPATQSYVKSVGQAYPYQAPPIRVGGEPSEYHPDRNEITVDQKQDFMLPSYVATARHEVDHALQFPKDYTEGRYGPGFREAAEAGPSLADALWIAHDHQAQTGRALDHDLTFPNGATQNVGWMNRQAQQHGLFRPGNSMTGLLATPSGQAYLKNLTQPAATAGPGDLASALNLTRVGR